jgi:hypothetical protein
MAQSKKIFIMAGTYAEAVKFARDNQLPKDKWFHLTSASYLKGCFNPRVFRIGTWEQMNPAVLKEVEAEIIHRTKVYAY